jgi:signal transduction histidine kinase
MQAPSHPREPRRLATLRRYRILDTPEERAFDEVVRLASVLCDAPLAAISFVDSDRQWFKAQLGFGVRQTPIDRSICAHAILADEEIFEVADAPCDQRLREHRLLVERPELRFYAAALLRSPDGLPIGTLCVLDTRTRRLTESQRLALKTLAHQVMVQLELRQLLGAQRERERRARASARAQRFLLQLEDALRALDEPGAVLDEVAARLGRHLDASRCGYTLVAPDTAGIRIACPTDQDAPVRRAGVALADLGAAASGVLQLGHALVIEDAAADGRLDPEGRAALDAAGIAALICVPLHKDSRLIGLLTVQHDRPRDWGWGEIRLARDAAERCRETLERLDAERRAARERRNAELALQAGKRSERRLIEADARKDEFLAMLAHELRNPLAPLANALHVLGRSPGLAEGDRAMLAMADRQLRQLRRLVDDLLEVSRITRGKIALRCEPVDVDAAVRGAVESVAAQVAQRGQRLELSLPTAPARIVADPVRVAQVLENLLNNASKYTSEGGSIRVEVRDGTNEVEIGVADNGIGIEPDKIPHLFEMFSQIDATIDRAQGGLGIGLAMVRRLVELHGGRVAAHSTGLGHGATFTLWLPHAGPAADGAGRRA